MNELLKSSRRNTSEGRLNLSWRLPRRAHANATIKRHLYERAGVSEYWIIDPRPRARRPTLLVRRRSGGRWRVSRHAYGSTYATPLLPGFELVVDPRR